MPDPNSFDLNNQPRAADAVAQIPTSASEVDIRTLSSDLEQMGKSGGMTGQAAPAPTPPAASSAPQAAGAEDRTTAPAPQAEAPAAEEEARPRSGLMRAVIITVIAILAAAALFALGFFVLG